MGIRPPAEDEHLRCALRAEFAMLPFLGDEEGFYVFAEIKALEVKRENAE